MHKWFWVLLLLVQYSIGQSERALNTVQVLCADSLHGRAYVKEGDKKAARFLVDQLTEVGAVPIKKNFTQDFPLTVNTFGGDQYLVQTDSLIPGKDFITSAYSKSFKGELNSILIPKTALLNLEKLPEFVQHITSEQTKPFAFVIDHTELSKEEKETAEQIAIQLAFHFCVVQLVDHAFMWTIADQQLVYPILSIQKDKFDPTKSFNVQVSSELKTDYQSQNVLAMIPAKRKSKKAKNIVFTAHYDHLGRFGSGYFPGANDNASGVAMLVQLAEYYAQNQPNFNVYFMAFSGEEAGLVGSKYFCKHPLFKLKKIDFLLNLDIMGTGEEYITVVNSSEHPSEFELLKSINTQNNFIETVKARGPAANSDHHFFVKNGVAAFYIYTTGPNKHYHDIDDTWDKLSFEKFDAICNLLIKFAEKYTAI